MPGLNGETPPPPTIVLAVDQGEELLNEDGRDETRRFIEILTGALKLRNKPHNTPEGGPWPRVETLQGTNLFKQYKAQAEMAHGEALLDYSVSPDRRWLATAGPDASVRLWPLSPEELRRHVCSRLMRNLTDKEWHEFQIDDGPRRSTSTDLP